MRPCFDRAADSIAPAPRLQQLDRSKIKDCDEKSSTVPQPKALETAAGSDSISRFWRVARASYIAETMPSVASDEIM